MKYNRKVLNFDMDGTIVNLYQMNNWLENLEKEQLDFSLAAPIFNDNFINKIIELKKIGFYIQIITWLPPTSIEYQAMVSKQKLEWIRKYFPIIDAYYILPYGKNKASVCNKYDLNFLIDDNVEVVNSWNESFKDEKGIVENLGILTNSSSEALDEIVEELLLTFK